MTGKMYVVAAAGLAAAAVLIAAGAAQVQYNNDNDAAIKQVGENMQLIEADLAQAQTAIAAMSDRLGTLASRAAAIEQRNLEGAAHINQTLAVLVAKVDALQASITNTTARITALEDALARQAAGTSATDDDYSPIIHIFYPRPDQFLAENTDASQGGPGVKIWPDYVAKLYDGTYIPNQSLDVVFTMHGPEPDNVVRGFHEAYHRGPSEYGQTTLTVSYTDTVGGRDYTTAESVTFYMGSTRK